MFVFLKLICWPTENDEKSTKWHFSDCGLISFRQTIMTSSNDSFNFVVFCLWSKGEKNNVSSSFFSSSSSSRWHCCWEIFSGFKFNHSTANQTKNDFFFSPDRRLNARRNETINNWSSSCIMIRWGRTCMTRQSFMKRIMTDHWHMSSRWSTRNSRLFMRKFHATTTCRFVSTD